MKTLRELHSGVVFHFAAGPQPGERQRYRYLGDGWYQAADGGVPRLTICNPRVFLVSLEEQDHWRRYWEGGAA